MSEEEKKVYLTFDDGPVPEVTPQVLDILKEKNIKATFFCVGENVQRNPDLLARIKEEGHSLGNHTFHHLQGIKCDDRRYYKDIEAAENLIGTGMFRPPHGLLKHAQYHHLKKLYNIVMWDVISCDYDASLTPEHCFCNVADFVRNGSIITFHDSIKAQKNVLAILPRVIDYLKEQGYSFGKIELEKKSNVNSLQWLRNLPKKIISGDRSRARA